MTKEISSETTVTASKVVVIVQGLLSATQKTSAAAATQLAKELSNTITEELNKRFGQCENNGILTQATFLDPRFKKNGFKSENIVTRVKDSITTAAAAIHDGLINTPATATEATRVQTQQANTNEDDLIWGDFDRRMSSVIVTPTSSAIMEVRQYLEEAYISRLDDPLMWWRGRTSVYPRLSHLARKKFCVVATSVPSERVFSKSGQLISERRSRLSAKNVQMIMFLNWNLKL